MSPAQTSLTRQAELQARRFGMRSLDPTEIARHFGRAAELRALLTRDGRVIVAGPTGTKGSCAPRPW